VSGVTVVILYVYVSYVYVFRELQIISFHVRNEKRQIFLGITLAHTQHRIFRGSGSRFRNLKLATVLSW